MQNPDGPSTGATPSWSLGQKYLRVLAAAGGIPWPVPLLPPDEATLRDLYEHLDGLLLAGGADVDPANYGEPKHAVCGETDPERDATEKLLLSWARADGLPVLGICRGIQVLNVAAGGTLYQDLAAEFGPSLKHDYFSSNGSPRDRLVHEVCLLARSRLAAVLGEGSLWVNSMHHQGIQRLGSGLRATAFAPDGLIEAIEAEGDAFLVGVQWHPEELTEKDAASRRLFTAFVEAASRFKLRAPAGYAP